MYIVQELPEYTVSSEVLTYCPRAGQAGAAVVVGAAVGAAVGAVYPQYGLLASINCRVAVILQ